MFIHPQFDPIAVSFGPLAVRWYALSYLAGFALFLLLGRRLIARGNSVFNREMLDNFLSFAILGVIIGGRLGFVLFYRPDYYLVHPGHIIKVWEGGMAFHGGFLGVLAAAWLFAHRYRLRLLQVSDFIAPLVPLGLACGRLGNFINGELWGRISQPDAWWAVGFPQAWHADGLLAAQHPQLAQWLATYGSLPRHPSQLYQLALEGLLLFIIVWLFARKPRPLGQISALFLCGYGSLRFIAEYFRQPDDYLGLLTLNLSMGQWLSLPMILSGFIGLLYFGRKNSLTS